MSVPARVLRLLHARRALVAGICVGAAAFLLAPVHHRVSSRLLFAWDAAVLAYLLLAGRALYRSAVDDIRRHAALSSEGRLTILFMLVAAISASFGAIVLELANSRVDGRTDTLAMILAALTVVLSWVFTHVVFAIHYAHEYYAEHPTQEYGGLRFPGGGPPHYADFLYFAFVIGCATATSDVNIESGRIRKVALVHGVLSFFYNTAILALMINIAAGLIPG